MGAPDWVDVFPMENGDIPASYVIVYQVGYVCFPGRLLRPRLVIAGLLFLRSRGGGGGGIPGFGTLGKKRRNSIQVGSWGSKKNIIKL